jgi:hypothetical protein
VDPVIRDKDSVLGRPARKTQCVVDAAAGIENSGASTNAILYERSITRSIVV